MRYEICVGCGKEWNVSVKAKQGWYICPDCRRKYQSEKRKGVGHGKSQYDN